MEDTEALQHVLATLDEAKRKLVPSLVRSARSSLAFSAWQHETSSSHIFLRATAMQPGESVVPVLHICVMGASGSGKTCAEAHVRREKHAEV